tara:strand:+ start:2686 stop:3384 length:699 start_codon:yes stop_codon:yes gene_type:complete
MDFQYINGIKTFIPNSKNELIDHAIDNKKILFAVNAEKIINSSRSQKSIINENFGYPDGFGAVWELKKRGYKNAKKIAGCDLWLSIIDKYYLNKSFYLIGAKQNILEKTVKKIKKQYNGIKIINYRNGYFNDNEDYELLYNDIVRNKPDIIFVAMGSPLQEKLIINLQDLHKATYMGLGGSFDIYAGKLKRAPDFFINYNLEWAFRLIREPQRFTRQLTLVPFFFKVLFRKL